MLKNIFQVKSGFKLGVVSCATLLLTACATQTPSSNSVITDADKTTGGQQVGAKTVQEPITPLAIPNWAEKPVPVTDLWQRIHNGFDLDIAVNHKRVRQERRWYSRHPDYMKRISQRGKRYIYHVIGEIEARDLPGELALLPIVESAYDPFAYSHGRASGMWQFIPGTGKRFGLKQDWWYDGRRDIVESTRAALDYLEYLHKRFDGDWLHALAAYNSGEGNVSKAIRKNKRLGKPTDFWHLDLPRETRAYVPKLIALAQLLDQPDTYGLEFPAVANKPYFTSVDVGSQIDLAQAASMADISLDELYLLNPGFNQWATPPDGPFAINVPVDKASGFEQQLALVGSQDRIKWVRYKIKSGDSLSTVAKAHRTSVKTLMQVNNLRNSRIRAHQTLMIPVAKKAATHYAMSTAQRLHKKQNTQARPNSVKKVHITRPGDSFWSLSRNYKVGMRELARWNNMGSRDTLPVGKKLVIWVTPDPKAAPSGERSIIRKIGYRVRNGDSLARIAQKFKVSISDIENWNGLNRKKYLQPGQALKLYVDVTRVSF